MRHNKILIAAPQFYEWDLGSYLLSILRSKYVKCDTFAYQPYNSDEEAGRELLNRIKKSKPDIMIGLKLDSISAEVLRVIKNTGVFVAVWYVDCVRGIVPEWIKPLFLEADVFFTTAKGMLSKYREIGSTPAYWLYEGAHVEMFPVSAENPSQKRIYRSDVAFVGSIYYYDDNGHIVTERERFLKKINEIYELKIWGPQGVKDARKRWGRSYPAVEWPAYNEELVNVCGGAKIILGVNTINSVELYFSNRTFITLASGGFHITHYVPGLETMFENRRHLVWYHSLEECLSLIEYYLERPGLRKEIARQGRDWVRRKYGMKRQVGKMLRIVEKHYGE